MTQPGGTQAVEGNIPNAGACCIVAFAPQAVTKNEDSGDATPIWLKGKNDVNMAKLKENSAFA